MCKHLRLLRENFFVLNVNYHLMFLWITFFCYSYIKKILVLLDIYYVYTLFILYILFTYISNSSVSPKWNVSTSNGSRDGAWPIVDRSRFWEILWQVQQFIYIHRVYFIQGCRWRISFIFLCLVFFLCHQH